MVVKLKLSFYKRRWAVCAFGLPLIMAVIVMAGCAGNAAKSMVAASGGVSGKAGSAAVDMGNPGSLQLRIGDDPATPDGRIVALRLDIQSMKLWNSTDPTVNLSFDFGADPVSVELIHESTVTVPISDSGANPNTTYDRLDISYVGSAVTFMDMPSGTFYNQELGPPPDQTVSLSTPVAIGTDPIIVNVNVNVPSFVSLPPIGNFVARGIELGKPNAARPRASGATQGSAQITVTQAAIPSGQEQPQNGQVQYLVAPVTKVVGNAITIKPSGKSSFTFNTDGNTDFEGVTLGTAPGLTVEINGSTQADGSLYAEEVELVDTGTGSEFIALVSSCANWLNMSLVVQDGVGAGMSQTLVGKTINSQLDEASFTVQSGMIDMTGVTAVFDGDHVFPGQQVEVEDMTGLQTDPDGTAGLVTPYMVELQQQTISGKAINYPSTGTVTSFDLVLPTDGSSPLANLNPGLTTVHVIQPSTAFPSGNLHLNNQNAQIRGLLFCQDDAVTGQFCTTKVMVAVNITSSN